jgi:mannose-6-phosphate isomerase-like protein (cupin superfamily)
MTSNTLRGIEMEPYQDDLKEVAKDSDDFRRVLFTGSYSQLVIMAVPAAEEIGEEVHEVDQILFAVEGEGEAILDGRRKAFEKGDVVAVPAGTRHNIRNTQKKPLKLFTVYSPPQHPAGTIHHTRADAVAAEAMSAAPRDPVIRR